MLLKTFLIKRERREISRWKRSTKRRSSLHRANKYKGTVLSQPIRGYRPFEWPFACQDINIKPEGDDALPEKDAENNQVNLKPARQLASHKDGKYVEALPSREQDPVFPWRHRSSSQPYWRGVRPVSRKGNGGDRDDGSVCSTTF